jgi:DNA-binding CsgD family transcriptional regulator
MDAIGARGDGSPGDVATALGTVAEGDPPPLEAVVPPLQRLLGADEVAAVGIEVEGDAASVTFVHGTPGVSRGRAAVEALIASHPRSFGAFDPARPEPRQRNTAVLRSDLVRWFGPDVVRPPTRAALAACGIDGEWDLVRALVCEGTSVRAWLGAFRRGPPFGERDRDALQAIVAVLEPRLALERRLGALPITFAALDAALEAVGAPCFVLRGPGRVVCANAAARALLDTQPRDLADRLRAAAAGRPARGWVVQRLASRGVVECLLVTLPVTAEAARLRARAAARRWGFTPRQAEVLALAAAGQCNKGIAAALGCAERTVELHVSACLEKACCENRTQLVAKVWTEPG